MSTAMPHRIAKTPGGSVLSWKNQLVLTCSKLHIRVLQLEPEKASEKTDGRVTLGDLIFFAGLLALVGTKKDEEAQVAHNILKYLLLVPQRTPRIRPALEAIPPTRGGVLRIVWAAQAFVRVTGRTLEQDYVKVDQVIKVMAQVSDPEAYVKHVSRQSGLFKLGVIFHPGTLESAKKVLRGAFAAPPGEPSYWERTEGQLNIIRD